MLSPLSRLGALVAVLALAAAFSCKTFSTPDEICDPSNLDAQRMHGEAADGDCSRCLEDKCCDKVGVCTNKDGCPDIVRGVHDCVLGKGLQAARDEQQCADDHHLTMISEADDAYRCMRDSCGTQCGLPVCRVDPAAVLFQNAKCDECFAGACCQPVNECYGSRACKLTLECIQSCKDVFAGPDGGPPGAAPSGPPPGAFDAGGASMADEDRLCSDAGAHDPNDPPACVVKCLCRFRNNDEGLKPLDAGAYPFTLASRVYDCGRNAGCLTDCAGGADDPDASK